MLGSILGGIIIYCIRSVLTYGFDDLRAFVVFENHTYFEGVEWSGVDWIGMDWSGLEGLEWTGLDWTGLEWKD